jgi:hypothetical protein
VKTDLAAVRRLDVTITFGGKKLGYTRLRHGLVGLHVHALSASMVFKPAPRRMERLAYRYFQVLAWHVALGLEASSSPFGIDKPEAEPFVGFVFYSMRASSLS